MDTVISLDLRRTRKALASVDIPSAVRDIIQRIPREEFIEMLLECSAIYGGAVLSDDTKLYNIIAHNYARVDLNIIGVENHMNTLIGLMLLDTSDAIYSMGLSKSKEMYQLSLIGPISRDLVLVTEVPI